MSRLKNKLWYFISQAVLWALSCHEMSRLKVAGRGADLRILKKAKKIINKQEWTSATGWWWWY